MCERLTKAEVNEELAVWDGWTKLEERQLLPEHKSTPPRLWIKVHLKHQTGLWYENAPNYCGNWNDIGPLFEKMVQAGGMLVAAWNKGAFKPGTGDTLTEAIAREVLAWTKNEK